MCAIFLPKYEHLLHHVNPPHSMAHLKTGQNFLPSLWANNLDLANKGESCSEILFKFATIELGDFETILFNLDSLAGIGFETAAITFWAQTRRIFRQLRRCEISVPQYLETVRFVHQCVQQYSFLEYGVNCGVKKVRKYLDE